MNYSVLEAAAVAALKHKEPAISVRDLSVAFHQGGKETVAIVQKSSDQANAVRYDYKLVATSKTSTLERELREVAEAGYEALDLTVGKTAMGGSEIVVITRRAVKQ